MATYYLKSGAGGVADGSSWTDAFVDLLTAVAALNAGDTLWVSNNHAESQTSLQSCSPATPGTGTNPIRIICVTENTPPDTRATTATVTTTGSSSQLRLVGLGDSYVYGITFTACDGGTSSNQDFMSIYAGGTTLTGAVFEECVFKTAATAARYLQVGDSVQTGRRLGRVYFKDCDLGVAATSQGIQVGGAEFIWEGGNAAAGASAPNFLFLDINSGAQGSARCMGLNLDTVSGYLVDYDAGGSNTYQFVDCKLHASVAEGAGTLSSYGSMTVEVINCSSADPSSAGCRFMRSAFGGVEDDETTIVRTGGAADGNGSFSRKLQASPYGNAHFNAYRTHWMETWNDSVGSAITVTVPIVYDSATNLQNDEVWLEVEYQGTSGNPLGLFQTNRISDPIFGTPADLTADGSSTWTGHSFTNENKDLLSVTITPQEKGIIRARVCLAYSSALTLYYDPLLQIS